MAKRLIDIAKLHRVGIAPQNRLPVKRAEGARFEMKSAGDGIAEMYIYDDIDWYAITSANVAAALAQVSATTLRVHINSRGGDIWEGVAIYNLLAQRQERVEVYGDAIVASIASVIAMAGDEIVMAKNAMMMVHRAWGCAVGDPDDMRSYAAILESLEDNQIIPTYADRTKLSVADLKAIMKAETWMNASDCVAKGFADRVGDPSAAKASVPEGYFARTPKELLRNAAESWRCEAATDLPIDKADAWDGEAAKERMFEAAGFNGSSPDSEKCRKGFLAYDSANPTEKGSYKLPFADIRDGKLTAMEGGLGAAASRLPNTDIPEDVKAKARKVLDDYYARRDEQQSSFMQRMRLRTRALAASL